MATKKDSEVKPAKKVGPFLSAVAKARRPDSGETITVPVTLEKELYAEILAMGAYDGRANFSDTISHSMEGDIVAWLEYGGDALSQIEVVRNRPIPFLKRWLKAHPVETLLAEAKPANAGIEFYLATDCRPPRAERIHATLDAHVTALLRTYASDNPTEDPRDVINGLLASMLESELFDRGRSSGETTDEARERRGQQEARSKQVWNAPSTDRPGDAIAHPATAYADVAFWLTAAQYKLAQRAAVADGLAADEVFALAKRALREVATCILSVNCGMGDKAAAATWEAAGEEEATEPAGAGPDRIGVELDELASNMLRQVCKHGDPCRHPGEDPRDLVNAAVTFYLCESRASNHEFDLSCGDEALERAKRDRLAKEKGAA